MAQLKDGKITGLVGEVVGFERNGKNYLRSAPVRTAPATEAELKNRHLLELVSQWLKPLTPFIRKGFRNYHPNYEGFSAAMAVNYREALQKNGFESFLDPTLAKVSSGDLELPENLQALLSPGKQLDFHWDIALNQGPRDRIMLLAYDPDNRQAFFDNSGPIRYKGTARLSLADAAPGSFHIYAAFVAEDGTRQSESEYLGSVSIE